MFGIPLGKSRFSPPDWDDPIPHMTPEGPKPRSITLETVLCVADVRELRRCSEHDGWPAFCPDPRCGSESPGGEGRRCVGTLRRLAPGRAREFPGCYAFALAAVIHQDDLDDELWRRAAEMLPATLLGEDEEEVGGPARGFAGPSPDSAGKRLAERLLLLSILFADGVDLDRLEERLRSDEPANTHQRAVLVQAPLARRLK